MRWSASWLCVGMLVAWLVGCGGGASSIDRDFGRSGSADLRRFVTAMHDESSVRMANAALPPFYVDTEALFDWAEWQYPVLFPKGPTTQDILYSGVIYKVRVYPNGNHLGESYLGIFALGPFNGDKIVRYGALSDFAPLVQNDACRIRPDRCAPPVIGTHPSNVHTEPGGSATFTVAATSALPLAIQWQSSLDGGVTFADVPGATEPSWTVRTELADDGRRVRARVSTRDGVVTSNAAWLMVRPAASSAFFPTDLGSRWVYRRSDGADPDVVRVTGSHPVDGGQSGTVFETTDGKDHRVWRDTYLSSSDGVRQYSPETQDAFLLALDGMQVLRFPVVVGETSRLVDKTVDSGVDVDEDGQTDSMHVMASLSVIGMEPVTTPAARFEQALHQRHEVVTTVSSSRGLGSFEVRSVVDVWYASGVGQVKWIIHQTAPGLVETLTYEVEAFQVGSLRSDAMPPRVEQRSPEGASFRPSRKVTAIFDERIDPASVGPDSLVVTDAQGRRVSGVVQSSGNSITFTPPADWLDGTYAVSLAAGVRDLSGNVQSTGALWSFTADSVLPQVVSTLPAANAKDVPLSSIVEIAFTELPALGTINARNVFMFRESPNSANPSLKATISIRGNTLVITPEARLQPGSNYTVMVSGLADAAGNSVPYTTWRFRTVEGRFAPQTSLVGQLLAVGQVAVTDIDGNGRPDVLLTSNGGLSQPSGTFIRYGLADGTLAEPVKLPGTTSCARYLSVADVNGDGRPDLLSGDDACQPVVLEKSANGSFAASQPLVADSLSRVEFANLGDHGKPVILITDSSRVGIWQRSDGGAWSLTGSVLPSDRPYQIVAADIDRNGSVDWVSSSFNNKPRIEIRWRGAAGDYSQATYLPLDWAGAPAAGGVAVGDLNGDGRSDIAATVYGSNQETSVIAVFYQGSASTFKPPVHIKTHRSPERIAIADIDGDGRDDVLVSHSSYPEQLGLYLQRPDGTLAPEELYDADLFRGGPIEVADINGDGRLDVLVAGTVFLQKKDVVSSMASVSAARPLVRRGVVPSILRARGPDRVSSGQSAPPMAAGAMALRASAALPRAQVKPGRGE